jgi:hypothetical protein
LIHGISPLFQLAAHAHLFNEPTKNAAGPHFFKPEEKDASFYFGSRLVLSGK